MEPNNTRYEMDKKTGRQFLIVCLLLLPSIVFSLSAFTFIPNTAPAPNRATETTLPLALQMSALGPGYAVDDGCSDVVNIVQSSWTEIKIYLNECAIEHLAALVASVGAVGAGLVSFLCPECDPIIAWIASLTGVSAVIDFLQSAAQGCGGAFLDFSLSDGIKTEPACDIQT
jgi:hypothetical protein